LQQARQVALFNPLPCPPDPSLTPPSFANLPLQPFFEAMHRALAPGGIVCTQAESLWYHLGIIKSLAAMCAEVFAGGAVQYAFTTIPTYPRWVAGAVCLVCWHVHAMHEDGWWLCDSCPHVCWFARLGIRLFPRA
jgi:hypothetical protein